MDDIVISLPCGLDKIYGNLKKRKKPMCLCCDEDCYIGDVINRPGNCLRLKEKQVEF